MVTNDKSKSQLLSLAATVFVLGLAYWLDTITISWRRQVHATFSTQSFYVFTVALPLLFAALAIFLAWVLLVRFRQTWPLLIFSLLVGVGSLGFVLSIVAANPILLQIVNFPFLTGLRRVIFELGPGSMTFQAGAFILVIGLINLIRTIAERQLGSNSRTT